MIAFTTRGDLVCLNFLFYNNLDITKQYRVVSLGFYIGSGNFLESNLATFVALNRKLLLSLGLNFSNVNGNNNH